MLKVPLAQPQGTTREGTFARLSIFELGVTTVQLGELVVLLFGFQIVDTFLADNPNPEGTSSLDAFTFFCSLNLVSSSQKQPSQQLMSLPMPAFVTCIIYPTKLWISRTGIELTPTPTQTKSKPSPSPGLHHTKWKETRVAVRACLLTTTKSSFHTESPSS